MAVIPLDRDCSGNKLLWSAHSIGDEAIITQAQFTNRCSQVAAHA